MSKRTTHYFKPQTKWVRIPAAIEAHRGDETVAVRIHHERAADGYYPPPAAIWLTPHEAQGFAAWLSQQADHILAKQARAAARKAARQAAKESKQ